MVTSSYPIETPLEAKSLPYIGSWIQFFPAIISNLCNNSIEQPQPMVSTHTQEFSKWTMPMSHLNVDINMLEAPDYCNDDCGALPEGDNKFDKSDPDNNFTEQSSRKGTISQEAPDYCNDDCGALPEGDNKFDKSDPDNNFTEQVDNIID
ncbi:hypothetical protein Glove_355g48 [Diversispora epigaea]|uniref:Uncharacterized protein n=1 Tax=Diversispora epigaea TaxID=1348612 RepID=A0A397HB65_9GLOM|nr:hypothetical protein Glove_355g48 [Diversispora epigaea]